MLLLFLADGSEMTCFVASFLIDVGGVDLLEALTLGILFTVTRSTILGTKITTLNLLLLVFTRLKVNNSVRCHGFHVVPFVVL